MARAFVECFAQETVTAASAGTMPSEQINPVVVEAMDEVNIHIGNSRPKLLTPEMVERADCVITMGCSVEDACPGFLVQAEDWGLEDPAGKPLDQVRKIRNEIEARVQEPPSRYGSLGPTSRTATGGIDSGFRASK